MEEAKIDQLAWRLAFGSETNKKKAYLQILRLAQKQGALVASMNDLYMARGREETPLDFSEVYADSTCIKANIHHPVDWLLFRDVHNIL